MNKLSTLLLLLLGLFFFSCQEDDDEQISFFRGYHYAPLETGMSRTYQVDSIIYNDFTGSVDTISLQRQERVGNAFTNLEGVRAYNCLIYERKGDTSAWVERKAYEELRNNLRYERRLDNQSVIHLVFPVSEGKRWNANALNPSEEVNYTYRDLHQAYTLFGHQYDSTVRVLQRETSNLISRIKTEEVYAINKGMIYRYDENLETDFDGSVRSGYIATIKLISVSP